MKNILFAAASVLPMMVSTAVAQQQKELTFKANSVIEIAYYSEKPSKVSDIEDEYLPRITPEVERYGAEVLGTFDVTTVAGGKLSPQKITIFQWKSLDDQKTLSTDKSLSDLFKIRDEAIASMKLARFTIKEDTTVTLKEDKVYQFYSGWLTPEAETTLPQYFDATAPLREKYGPTFIATFDALPVDNPPNFIITPHTAGIVEWDRSADHFAMLSDPEFLKAKPLLDRSTTRLDMFHGEFTFKD